GPRGRAPRGPQAPLLVRGDRPRRPGGPPQLHLRGARRPPPGRPCRGGRASRRRVARPGPDGAGPPDGVELGHRAGPPPSPEGGEPPAASPGAAIPMASHAGHPGVTEQKAAIWTLAKNPWL